MKVYTARKGSHLTDAEAQVCGPHLDKLTEKNNGMITAEIVLENAKKKTSVLHDYFEWDDTAAALQHRLQQARGILNSIKVVVVRDNEQEETVRAFHVVTIKNEKTQTNERGYTTIERVANDVDLRRQVLGQALKELEAWQRRYETYSELLPVFEAISVAREQAAINAAPIHQPKQEE